MKQAKKEDIVTRATKPIEPLMIVDNDSFALKFSITDFCAEYFQVFYIQLRNFLKLQGLTNLVPSQQFVYFHSHPKYIDTHPQIFLFQSS